jgi:hypothetical protein
VLHGAPGVLPGSDLMLSCAHLNVRRRYFRFEI